ncbi:MAG: WecB/TagA/CpsF family glycosyltransferase [Phycisphaerales bacterium]|nr:WecB/TagA/CpsF family glycosyltransferase [Phycisphaerales bacterium]
MGIPLHAVTLAGAVEHVAQQLRAGCGGWVITPNLDILRRLVTEPAFAALSSNATLRLADGMPLVWASRLRGTPLPERVAGSDLIYHLCERCARDVRSVYFLGGNPGTAQTAASQLAARYPGLRVAGTECPPFGFESDAAYMARLESGLASVKPDVVLVALGSPKQEALIERLRHLLPATWFLGIGVTFSFVSGDIRRAPPWMRRVGLEWSHRLMQEPRRLAKRYLVQGLPFAARLLVVSALARHRHLGKPGREQSASITRGTNQ